MKFANKKNNNYSEDFWNVLIVDDEEEVHSITGIVLRNFTFENKQIKLYDTYNMADTKKLLEEKNDFALIFLDIVMETDDAGLLLTKYIREELNNHTTRIILRTGQPGSAPEQKIIIDYDINDYKEKTELSATKLTTAVVSSIRAYSELMKIKNHEEVLIQEVKDSVEELKNRNCLIQNQITNLNNQELMSEISHQLKIPLDEIKIEISKLVVELNAKDINPVFFKEEIFNISTKIKALSKKIDNYN